MNNLLTLLDIHFIKHLSKKVNSIMDQNDRVFPNSANFTERFSIYRAKFCKKYISLSLYFFLPDGNAKKCLSQVEIRAKILSEQKARDLCNNRWRSAEASTVFGGGSHMKLATFRYQDQMMVGVVDTAAQFVRSASASPRSPRVMAP